MLTNQVRKDYFHSLSAWLINALFKAVINFVTEMIGEGKYPEVICEELLGYCLAPVCQMGGLGGDNMSIIIVCLLHGKPWEHLVEKCKKIHFEKKASTKLKDPAFSKFDRLTDDGPFADVSVLKTTEDLLNHGDSTSSSSHTSSPSSSPISTDEKFDGLLVDASGSENTEKSNEVPSSAQSEEASKAEIKEVSESIEASNTSAANSVDHSRKIEEEEDGKTPSTAAIADEAAIPAEATDPIVSNGN